MANKKVDSEQLNRSFESARAIASAIITGVFAKEEEEGSGNFEALEEEATKWIEDYANGTEEEAGPAASDVEALVSLLKERRNYYSEKSERLLLSDQDQHEIYEFKDAVFMYGNYINVIADIRSYLKEKQPNDR